MAGILDSLPTIGQKMEVPREVSFLTTATNSNLFFFTSTADAVRDAG